MLEATYEGASKPGPPKAPLVEVHQKQEGASASASARATVDVTVSVDDFKRAVVEANELTPDEQAALIAAIPATDDEVPTIEKVNTMLGIATRAKSLFQPLLAWLLTHADKIDWP